MSENSPVRHRIDGLENLYLICIGKFLVRHRIDGLEIDAVLVAAPTYVRHRIDGLEKYFALY